MQGSFVYVIADETGRHKIGSSKDPFQRISALQTGSSSALRFAYIGVTPGVGSDIEFAAHDLLDAQRVHREWFAVPASIAIGAVIEAAGRLNQAIQQVSPEMVPQIIYQATMTAPETPPGTVKVKHYLRDFVMSVVVVGLWGWLIYHWLSQSPS
jgi:hypothetical protein